MNKMLAAILTTYSIPSNMKSATQSVIWLSNFTYLVIYKCHFFFFIAYAPAYATLLF